MESLQKNNIQIWLSVDGSTDRLRLPVNPEKVSVSSGYDHEEVEIAHLGKVTLFGNRQLKQFSFDSFLPKTYNPSYCEYVSIPDPYWTIQKVKGWADAKKPLRLTVTGGLNINILVTLRSIEHDERFGEIGDIYYTMSLVEYEPFTTHKQTVQNSTANPVNTTHPQATTNYWVVRSGDTLYEIAHAYSNCTLNDIYALNPGIKATALKIGQKVYLPMNAKKVRDPKRISNTSRPKSTSVPSSSKARPSGGNTPPTSSQNYNDLINEIKQRNLNYEAGI